MYIMMKGFAGDLCAAVYARQMRDRLEGRFSSEYIKRIDETLEGIRVREKIPDGAIGLTEGLYAALWRIGEREKCGVEIDALEIPVKQEIIEVCELAGVNPYEGISSGYLYLSEIPTSDVLIGETKNNNDRVIRLRDHNRFLYRP